MLKEWKIIDTKPDRDYRVFKVNTMKALSPRTNEVGEF